MSDFGVTPNGFAVKGIEVIVAESLARARQVFGPDIDLSATSPLRQILDAKAAEDAELWKAMEAFYYSNFIATASGSNLDLLGADLGLERRQEFLSGTVLLTLANPEAGRTYRIAAGLRLVTNSAPGMTFATQEQVTLAAEQLKAEAPVVALQRGGSLPGLPAFTVEPKYLAANLRLGAATIAGVASEVFSGTNAFEADDVYRKRLLGLPRNLWTEESVRRAVLEVDGVIDVLLSDPLGGVDVSQTYFNQFKFDQRPFSAERRPLEPYFVDIVVANELTRDWEEVAAAVAEKIKTVRPIGIFPNIIQADNIDVGFRCTAVIVPGTDADALLAAMKLQVATRLSELGELKLGGDVLYSQVISALTELPGVVDIQHLHLRRQPPLFSRILFGGIPFQDEDLEVDAGENLVMGPREIARFRLDSNLIQIEERTTP
jgi:phage-related baseplate assembly protein